MSWVEKFIALLLIILFSIIYLASAGVVFY